MIQWTWATMACLKRKSHLNKEHEWARVLESGKGNSEIHSRRTSSEFFKLHGSKMWKTFKKIPLRSRKSVKQIGSSSEYPSSSGGWSPPCPSTENGRTVEVEVSAEGAGCDWELMLSGGWAASILGEAWVCEEDDWFPIGSPEKIKSNLKAVSCQLQRILKKTGRVYGNPGSKSIGEMLRKGKVWKCKRKEES